MNNDNNLLLVLINLQTIFTVNQINCSVYQMSESCQSPKILHLHHKKQRKMSETIKQLSK